MLPHNNAGRRGAIVAHLPKDDQFAFSELLRVAASRPDFEIIGVQDGWSVHPATPAGVPNLRMLTLEVELGKGAALRAGFNESDAAIVCFLDLGGTVDARDVDVCFRTMEAQPALDGIIGSRFMRESELEAPLFRNVASRLFDTYGRLLFGLHRTDPQGPLKVFRRSAVLRIFSDLRLYNHGFDVELLFQAQRVGLRLVDMPVRWTSGHRRWAMIPTALHAASALLMLRLLHSPFKRLPGVDLIGRHYAIPAKTRYSILIFCWRDPLHPQSGGSEAFFAEQARLWIAAGHSVTWFAQHFPGAKKTETFEGIEIVRYGRFPSVFACAPIWYLLGSHRNFDFIIDCMNGIPFFTPLFSTKPKVCLVHHLHAHHFIEELPWPVGPAAAFFETGIAPRAYRRTPFITVSESTRSEMEEHNMSPLPIGLIHNGVGPECRPGVKSDVPTVLYLGRLKRYKRIRKLIDAFVNIRAALPDARLVIAGTGDDEEALRAYAADSVDGITFLGRVSDEEKIRLMQEAWVFGMPSSVEGWGIVVIEANACGTPALVYDVPGLRECVKDGETGIVVRSDAQYAQALRLMLTDGEFRSELSRRAVSWAGNFSWRATAERTLEMMRLLQPWRAVFEQVGDDKWALVSRPDRLLGPSRGANAPIR